MNLLDIASFANADLNTYCLVLILANIILLPKALLIYKENNISLKNEIYSKDTLGRDIMLGLVLAAVSSAVSLLSLLVSKGRTVLAFTGWGRLSVGEMILMTISLGSVSGICKEIYFRGFAKNFCGDVFGETTALLMFNVLFGMLDWFNMGHSFLVGLLWIVLGFQLNPDGTMKDELIERLNVALASAGKYKNAYVVCTGGGTAAENESATEAGEMSKWLEQHGNPQPVQPKQVVIDEQSDGVG